MWLLMLFIVMRIVRTFLPEFIGFPIDMTWWMVILWPNPAVFAVGWISGVLAWVAIIRQHERAIVTYIAALVAVLISILGIAIMAIGG
jgi:hypothetical protein